MLLTAAEILTRGLALPSLPGPPVALPAGATCAITGVAIAEGYALRPLLQASTAVILDTIRGNLDGYVSDAAARCWKNTGPGAALMRGGLFFADGPAYQPLIALAGRENGRGCWRDVVREVWPARQGQALVMILTTNTKLRLWPSARAGPLGDATPVLLCDGDRLQVLTVSWSRLLDCLAVVELAYEMGFPKAAIRDSLLGVWKQVDAWGLPDVLATERQLAPWRSTPEFTVALLIAQRQTIVVPPPPRAAMPPVRVPVQESLFDV